MDLHHIALTLFLGDLYPSPHLVEEALRPREDYTCKILDIGTGSGSWYAVRFGYHISVPKSDGTYQDARNGTKVPPRGSHRTRYSPTTDRLVSNCGDYQCSSTSRTVIQGRYPE